MIDAGKNITVADIAKKAGVSPATVSRVLNHSHLVSPSTYDKVMEAIERLGYELPESRELFARSQPDSSLIAVNIGAFGDIALTEYMNGIHTAAYRYDWTPVLTQDPLTARTVDAYIVALQRMRAAGLIALNYAEADILTRIGAQIPIVQCGEYNDDAPFPHVGIDDAGAARAVVAHLIASGARRIALVNAPDRFRYARERRKGYEQALRDAGIEPDPADIVDLTEPNYAMAHAFVNLMFSYRNHPDAIFAANDTIAYAAVVAAREQGLDVPGDIAIAGFGNQDLSLMSVPKITTVSQPRFQMGFIGCELLRELSTRQIAPTQHITLKAELIPRGSTR